MEVTLMVCNDSIYARYIGASVKAMSDLGLEII